MNTKLLCALGAIVAGTLPAQSNTVAGLDGRITVIDDLTYWGRRGSSHPNGEVGMSMLNTMCNPGSVVIPWYAAMQPDHPMFGFVVVRESGGRMVQISDWSYCKHAFTSINVNGQCGPCVDPGTGSLMGLNCSDTYSAGNNGSRRWLGPPEEINPWLGTWDPIGSYFDRGDPPVTGAAATDGVRSLSGTGFDSVENRVTVQESDLLIPGEYYYGIHLIHEGESDQNRWDNTASRGFTPSWNGSSWNLPNNTTGQVYGSILQHWDNAMVEKGKNGNSDGNFYVAAVVTPLGGGQFHYEYAVQNLDNHGGGAAFRIPIDPAGTVSNVGFRDIDTNGANDWTFARVGNELVWTAPANAEQRWNTIYNFWFDCDVAASVGPSHIDQAGSGTPAAQITVDTRVPSGIPGAAVDLLGEGCGDCASSFYESFGSASSFDLANRGATLSFANGAYTVGPLAAGVSYITPTGSALGLSDDDEQLVALGFPLQYPGGSTSSVVVCSNGFVSVASGNGTPYTPSVGGLLGGIPRWAISWHDYNPSSGGAVRVDRPFGGQVVAITWDNVADFGAFGSQSTFQIQFHSSDSSVHVIYRNMSGSGNGHVVGWSRGGSSIDPGSSDLSAAIPAGFTTCSVDSDALALDVRPRPILGTMINFDMTGISPGSTAGAVEIAFTAFPSPIDLGVLGAPGCALHLVGAASLGFPSNQSSASIPLMVPNDMTLSGRIVYTQALTLSPGANAFGIITSNAAILTLGPQ